MTLLIAYIIFSYLFMFGATCAAADNHGDTLPGCGWFVATGILLGLAPLTMPFLLAHAILINTWRL